MKVSIVTISFNQVAFLEQAIRSVVEQEYPEIEYILVDPGSTDGSRDIIKKYQSKINHILLEPDAGPSDGLNKGFSLATGDVYGYLNSDDFYLPGAFNKITEYFRRHPNVDVVSGNANVVDENNILLRRTYSDRYSLLACAYGFSNLIQPSSFFRADAYKRSPGFNIENRSNWDGELFVDMKMMGAKFDRINDFLSAYRIYGASITGSGNLDLKIKAYHKRRFYKIMHRNPVFLDKLAKQVFRIYRYATNPLDLYNRILYGPIYARYS